MSRKRWVVLLKRDSRFGFSFKHERIPPDGRSQGPRKRLWEVDPDFEKRVLWEISAAAVQSDLIDGRVRNDTVSEAFQEKRFRTFLCPSTLGKWTFVRKRWSDCGGGEGGERKSQILLFHSGNRICINRNYVDVMSCRWCAIDSVESR